MKQVYQDERGGWRFRIKGGNGEVVAGSEPYDSASNAERGIETLHRILDESRGERPVRV